MTDNPQPEENVPVAQKEEPKPYQGLVDVNPADSPVGSDQFAVEGNDTSGFVGVSDEYRTYADDTQKPEPGGQEYTEQIADKPTGVTALENEDGTLKTNEAGEPLSPVAANQDPLPVQNVVETETPAGDSNETAPVPGGGPLSPPPPPEYNPAVPPDDTGDTGDTSDTV